MTNARNLGVWRRDNAAIAPVRSSSGHRETGSLLEYKEFGRACSPP